MKIVILGPAWPFRGGISQLNESLASELMLAGHDVSIVSFTTQYPSFLFPGKSQYTQSAKRDELRITRLLSSVNPLTWFKTARAIARAKPDLVIVRYWMPFMAPALGTVCRNLKAKGIEVLAITDNIVPHERHFYDSLLTQYFLGGTSSVLYMSGEVGRQLHEKFAYKGRSAFSPHPIYDVYGAKIDRGQACDALGLDPSREYVLFFGFIRDYKGLDLLLEAWQPHEGRSLIVAGEFYGNREKYMSLIESKGVILHDQYIDDDRVKYYFSAASLVVQPYKTATQSGVTQIAYNFGVPMVVSSVGGLPEIVPDGRVGFVVEPTADRISWAIEKFFADELHDLFVRNIEQEKRRFEWRAMVEQVEQLAR